MQGYQKCNNGHFFKDNMPKCPYCSESAGASGGAESTMVVGGGAGMPPTVSENIKTEA